MLLNVKLRTFKSGILKRERHSLLSDVWVHICCLSGSRFFLIIGSGTKMMAEEADQDLWTAHISATHIPVSEYERDATWKPFFLNHDDNQGAIASTPDGRTARQTEKMTRTTG